MHKRWKYFLKNIKNDALEYSVIVAKINTFLEHIFDVIVNEEEWQKNGKAIPVDDWIRMGESKYDKGG